jgi:hypothetical protein
MRAGGLVARPNRRAPPGPFGASDARDLCYARSMLRRVLSWPLVCVCAVSTFAYAVDACCAEPERGSVAAPAVTSARVSARTLGYAGVEAYRVGDYVAAEQNFSQAFTLLPVPSLGLWSARSLLKLGRMVEAAGRYRQVAGLPVAPGEVEIQTQARADALAEQRALLPRIPRLRIELIGARSGEVEVLVDGVSLARALGGEALGINPGTRLVVGRRGGERQEVVVKAREGQQVQATLTFHEVLPSEPLAERPTQPTAPPFEDENPVSPPWRSVGWVGVGVGSAALVLSGVLGLVANGKRSSFKDACPGDVCPSDVSRDVRDDVSTYDTLRTLSTVGWITGGVLAAGGLVLLFTAPATDGDVSLGLGPFAFELRGRF